MKHLLRLSLAILFCVPLTGCNFHGDSGNWRGSAVFRDSLGASTRCLLEVDITHTDDFVSLNRVSNNCGTRATRFSLGSFELRGQELWRGGRVLGRVYADDSVRLELTDPYLDYQYPYPAKRVVISWTRVGEYLQYSEKAEFDGREQNVEGWLRLKDETQNSGTLPQYLDDKNQV